MKCEVISDHRDYPSRWGVLGTVFFLNIANNALWISYSSVASTSAEYYEKSVSDVDWLGSIGFIVGKVETPFNPNPFRTSKLVLQESPCALFQHGWWTGLVSELPYFWAPF